MDYETFPSLTGLPHAFTLRTAGQPDATDLQHRVLAQLDCSPSAGVTAEQTHGNGVAIVKQASPTAVPMVDALATRVDGLPLIIRCADCAAVYIFDQNTPAIGLIHSGKRGTAANITGQTLRAMQAAFGTRAADCRAVISPCIGPCHYEVDLWAAIETQLRDAGVTAIQNTRICTACHLTRYYSYRAEKGHTGRMLAVLALPVR